MPSIMDTLIIDRTQQDVVNKTAIAYYNASDLNRVQAAMEYLVKELAFEGYSVPGFLIQKQWNFSDIPSEEEMNIYLQNVRLVRDSISVNSSIPYTISFLGYTGANNIEKALVEVEKRLLSLKKVFIRCNAYTAHSGLNYYIDKSADYIILQFLCDSVGMLLCDSDGVQLVSR